MKKKPMIRALSLKELKALDADLGLLDFGDSELKRLLPLDATKNDPVMLVTCRDEKHQLELLEKFQKDGVECRALSPVPSTLSAPRARGPKKILVTNEDFATKSAISRQKTPKTPLI